MKKSPTALMKELRKVEQQINEIHSSEISDSIVPVDRDYNPLYEEEYSYEENRKTIASLFERATKIKTLLNVFNVNTKVIGYDFTVAEGLVKLAQLKSEKRTLEVLAKRSKFTRSSSRYSDETIYKVTYDISKAKKDLEKVDEELCALQVAIDKTNLTSFIEA